VCHLLPLLINALPTPVAAAAAGAGGSAQHSSSSLARVRLPALTGGPRGQEGRAGTQEGSQAGAGRGTPATMATAVQKLRAIHLYRHSLKNMLSWAVRREVFYAEVGGWAGGRVLLL